MVKKYSQHFNTKLTTEGHSPTYWLKERKLLEKASCCWGLPMHPSCAQPEDTGRQMLVSPPGVGPFPVTTPLCIRKQESSLLPTWKKPFRPSDLISLPFKTEIWAELCSWKLSTGTPQGCAEEGKDRCWWWVLNLVLSLLDSFRYNSKVPVLLSDIPYPFELWEKSYLAGFRNC